MCYIFDSEALFWKLGFNVENKKITFLKICYSLIYSPCDEFTLCYLIFYILQSILILLFFNNNSWRTRKRVVRTESVRTKNEISLICALWQVK